MDEPGTCSWMTWKQVALAGREPNESCRPMIMIPLETCQSTPRTTITMPQQTVTTTMPQQK